MNNAPKSDEDWQADCDARTITEAEAIKADEPRLKRAQTAAKRMLEEEEAKRKALEKLANADFFPNTPELRKKKEA